MSIRYDNERLCIFNDSVDFDPYYFAIAAESENMNYHVFVNRVFYQWAEALAKVRDETLYFPFGIYDQSVECFNVTMIDERVIIRRVWFFIFGHTLNLKNLDDFIYGDHGIGKSSPVFGEYDRSALIQALKQAQPIAE